MQVGANSDGFGALWRIDSVNNWQCKYLMYCICSCPEAHRLRQTIAVPGLDLYKLPGGQKFSIKLSLLSVGFPERRPLNFIKRPRFINSPGARFIDHPATVRIPSFFYTPLAAKVLDPPPTDNARLCPDWGLCRPSCCSPFLSGFRSWNTQGGGKKQKL